MSTKLKSALNWILDRLAENSTWRGIILTLTGVGIALDPEQMAKITAIGLGIVGVINIIRKAAPTKVEVAEALATKQDKA